MDRVGEELRGRDMVGKEGIMLGTKIWEWRCEEIYNCRVMDRV